MVFVWTLPLVSAGLKCLNKRQSELPEDYWLDRGYIFIQVAQVPLNILGLNTCGDMSNTKETTGPAQLICADVGAEWILASDQTDSRSCCLGRSLYKWTVLPGTAAFLWTTGTNKMYQKWIITSLMWITAHGYGNMTIFAWENEKCGCTSHFNSFMAAFLYDFCPKHRHSCQFSFYINSFLIDILILEDKITRAATNHCRCYWLICQLFSQ